MAVPNLSSLSLEDLTATIAEATRLRSSLVATKRAELEKQLAALDSLDSPKPATGNRASPKPMYRSKANPTLAWSGRGSQPRWMTAELEESGLSRDALRIK
jgi:DNA-binding protein H-NS